MGRGAVSCASSTSKSGVRLSLVSSKYALFSASATERSDPGTYLTFKSYRCNISIIFCSLSGASCRTCLRYAAMACGLSQRLLFFHKCTYDISAPNTQLQGFPFPFLFVFSRCWVGVRALDAQARGFSSCKRTAPSLWNLHLQRGIMAYLDHSNQGLVLRRPSALASESFLRAGDPSAMQRSSLIILLMVHFQWPCLA